MTRKAVPVNLQSKLDSIQRFLRAGLAMSDIHVRRALEELEQTGHSCYNEGWAAGYQAAVKMVNEFVADTVVEQ